jgi:hypothetical protein
MTKNQNSTEQKKRKNTRSIVEDTVLKKSKMLKPIYEKANIVKFITT